MNIQTPTNSLSAEPAEKPETKPAGTPRTKSEGTAIITKAQFVNQAWADEVVASFNLNGTVAKAVATALSKDIASERAVIRLASRSSLAKRVRDAVSATIV